MQYHPHNCLLLPGTNKCSWRLRTWRLGFYLWVESYLLLCFLMISTYTFQFKFVNYKALIVTNQCKCHFNLNIVKHIASCYSCTAQMWKINKTAQQVENSGDTYSTLCSLLIYTTDLCKDIQMSTLSVDIYILIRRALCRHTTIRSIKLCLWQKG